MAALRAWAVAAATLIAACSGSSAPRLSHLTDTRDYLPGVAADAFLPGHTAHAPVVVLIPGGGWRSADRDGLRPLAEALASHGVAAFTATYRVGTDQARFPVPVADILCAVDFAVARTRRSGITPEQVVLLGHSSGGQLAALAALAPARFRGRCPYPAAHIDGFIGLAGAYEPISLGDAAEPLFGVPSGTDPALWREGEPKTWAAQRATLPVLLLHGASDNVLSTTYSTVFAIALRKAGHPVVMRIVPGATHDTIYHADVALTPVLRWLHDL